MRKEGKKESDIIELIREDNIEKFISFVEHSPINLNASIYNKTFEYSLQCLTPFEYSALFGSIRIFKYLYMRDINSNTFAGNNIIRCAVRGRNYEIIHILEERKDLSNQKRLQEYLDESLKIHHNEIFDHFITNHESKITKEIISLIVIFRNYQLIDQLIERNQVKFNDKSIISNIFIGFCQKGNEEIVKILMNHPNLDINSKDNIFDYSFEKNKIHRKNEESARKYSLLLIKIELNKEYLIRNIILLIWSILFYIITPFNSACNNGHLEIVKILMNHPNIDINLKNDIFDHSLGMIKIHRKNEESARKYSWLFFVRNKETENQFHLKKKFEFLH